MNDQITAQLAEIERQRGVRILYAIESGSRAWGFESTDSDFDVRFVYLGAAEAYLTVLPRRDVIENDEVKHPNPLLDFAGWDFRKFLGLVNKSNPVAFEWMQSPMSYQIDPRWSGVKASLWPFFSPKAAMHHYLSMARHNYREHMRDGQAPNVRLKKYLYITRPLMCCRWMERAPDAGPPPMGFNDVMDGSDIDAELRAALLDLVARKKAGEELDEGPAIPPINRFIDTELWRLRLIADKAAVGRGSLTTLDALFRSFVLDSA